MERKINVILATLTKLEQLDSIVMDAAVVDRPEVVGDKVNELMDSLAFVHEEGRSLDETSMFPVPLDLFDHLDVAADNNPELYRLKLIEGSDDHAANLKDKIAYLDQLKARLQIAFYDSQTQSTVPNGKGDHS